MALMVLQPSDFQPGATAGPQQYSMPQESDLTAEYDSVYYGATTADGTKLDWIIDDVVFSSSGSGPSNWCAAENALDTTKAGHRITVRALVAHWKKLQLKPKDFKFSTPTSAGVGTGSDVEIITITDKHSTLQYDEVSFLDGDICAGLGMVGARIPQGDAIALARAADAHIRATPGSGATGASGTT